MHQMTNHSSGQLSQIARHQDFIRNPGVLPGPGHCGKGCASIAHCVGWLAALPLANPHPNLQLSQAATGIPCQPCCLRNADVLVGLDNSSQVLTGCSNARANVSATGLWNAAATINSIICSGGGWSMAL